MGGPRVGWTHANRSSVKYVIHSIGAVGPGFYTARMTELPPVRTLRPHERPELRLRTRPQSRLDEAIGRAHERRELGARVHVQLLVDVDDVRGDGALADAEALGNLAVCEPVHDIAHDLALTRAELVEHCADLAGNQVRDAVPVGLVLATHDVAQLIERQLVEQFEVVELARVLHRRRDARLLAVGGEYLATWRTRHPQNTFFIRHGELP